jgi:hypothetical protein
VIPSIAPAVWTKSFPVLAVNFAQYRSLLIEMLEDNRRVNGRKRAWWVAMFHDIQFWVPLAVLLAGLILLRAIQ